MTAIQVENLSKAYQLGQIGTGTISRDLERFFVTKILGKEDPFLKIGQTNDRTIKGTSDIVWSLKDINFNIEQGDAVGIIGRNGAGKSTLLKLLSRVTSPTTGSIKVQGRVASLLEVGTGFHPELSGRENIYLNGAILGMRKAEIKRKFDEIVDFSGVERYIDTPVKRYSSGMYVRLAFAVAAHLESEILIVDEVLAVGDAEFQKKCLGKMGDISKGEGRTVLFVSHNMAAVKSLCSKGVVLENGLIKFNGEVDAALNVYTQNAILKDSVAFFDENTKRTGAGTIRFNSIKLFNQDKNCINEFSIGDDIFITFEIENQTNEKSVEFGMQIFDSNEMPIFHIMPRDSNFDVTLNTKKQKYSVLIKDVRLFPGIYYINLTISTTTGHEVFDYITNAISFEITDGGTYTTRKLPRVAGLFFLNPEWRKLDL